MKTLKLLLAITAVALLLINGCVYKYIVPEEIPDIPDPNDTTAVQISFANEIVPIFTNGNFCTACHKTGSQAPDLTADNAYNSLRTTKYLNKDNPQESKIYKYPHPDTSTHTRKKYSAAQANLILGWIIQGAKDN